MMRRQHDSNMTLHVVPQTAGIQCQTAMGPSRMYESYYDSYYDSLDMDRPSSNRVHLHQATAAKAACQQLTISLRLLAAAEWADRSLPGR